MAGLVADYGSDTLSSSDTDSEEESIQSKSGNLPKPRLGLPKPDFNSSANESIGEGSVFVNPFVEADNAKRAILEKHVKMISTDIKTLNGKKICWNYRKNKCRFGHNCKYAHDSDLQIDPSSINGTQTHVQQVNSQHVGLSSDGDQEEVISRGHKRPGLSQTIQPSKRVMKSYNQQKLRKK